MITFMSIVHISLRKIVSHMNDPPSTTCIAGKLTELLLPTHMYDWCMYLGIKKVYQFPILKKSNNIFKMSFVT